MIKLKDILTEILNTFQIECNILTDKNFNITECGDLRDIVDFRNSGGNLVGSESSDIPSFEDL